MKAKIQLTQIEAKELAQRWADNRGYYDAYPQSADIDVSGKFSDFPEWMIDSLHSERNLPLSEQNRWVQFGYHKKGSMRGWVRNSGTWASLDLGTGILTASEPRHSVREIWEYTE